jgi:hypothetical protein
VIKEDKQPALGDMTSIAGIVGVNMAGVLTRCDVAVVTAFAGTTHLGMVDMANPRPTEGRVAELAGITR